MLPVHLFQVGFTLAFILVASPADSVVQINQGLTLYLICIFILIIHFNYPYTTLYKKRYVCSEILRNCKKNHKYSHERLKCFGCSLED